MKSDNEIIKAMECCTVGTFACGKECPYYSSKSNLKVSSCRFELMCEISDLINRQNEEIERLLKAIKDKHCVYEKRVVTEAIKEFAEQVEEALLNKKFLTRDDIPIIIKNTRQIKDNRVKEMVGDEE